jgi:hypothetical protein
MRGIVLSLAAVSGLGAVLIGSRGIAAVRGGPAQPAVAAATRATLEGTAGPVYYGGRLAPIVVVATAPPEASAGPIYYGGELAPIVVVAKGTHQAAASPAQECVRAPS